MRWSCLFPGIVSIRVATTLASAAESVVLQPAADTTLFAAFTANNFGGADSLVVGANAHDLPGRALLKFELPAEIPANATITRAALTLTITRQPPSPVASTFHAHRMLKDWVEGSGTGNTGRAAREGESTWNNRMHPDEPWSAAGGTAGQEYTASSSASVLVEGDGSIALESAAMAEDVQLWLVDPAQNFGWILISDMEATAQTARRLGSRESAANAPALTIEYITGPAAPMIRRVTRQDDRIELEFEAVAGNVYEVQFTEDLVAASAWIPLTNYIAKLVTTNVIATDLLNAAARRFYRVADLGDVD